MLEYCYNQVVTFAVTVLFILTWGSSFITFSPNSVFFGGGLKTQCFPQLILMSLSESQISLIGSFRTQGAPTEVRGHPVVIMPSNPAS